MKEILKFLKRLSANNDREWFAEHKEEYLKIKEKADRFAEVLIAKVAEFEPDSTRLTLADCTYRIYRDTRFSADKTPYKTHIGIFINPPFGKKSLRMGYYLHIEPGNSFACSGAVCLPGKTLTAIRKSIRDNIDELLDIIRKPGFTDVFGNEIGINPLKTAPKGFPKDWEYIDLVKPRDFMVTHQLSDSEMSGKDILEKVTDIFLLAKPFRDFMNFAIDNPDLD